MESWEAPDPLLVVLLSGVPVGISTCHDFTVSLESTSRSQWWEQRNAQVTQDIQKAGLKPSYNINNFIPEFQSSMDPDEPMFMYVNLLYFA